MVLGIFEAALFGSCDGCAESGEEDDVVGLFGEDVLGAFLDKARHGWDTIAGGIRVEVIDEKMLAMMRYDFQRGRRKSKAC